jgi:hypothetical protein
MDTTTKRRRIMKTSSNPVEEQEPEPEASIIIERGEMETSDSEEEAPTEVTVTLTTTTGEMETSDSEEEAPTQEVTTTTDSQIGTSSVVIGETSVFQWKLSSEDFVNPSSSERHRPIRSFCSGKSVRINGIFFKAFFNQSSKNVFNCV